MLANRCILQVNNYYKNMKYKYDVFPNIQINKDFGLYINIPFYPKKCEDFMYYETNYNLNLETEFLYCLSKEVNLTNFYGETSWFYIDGLAPNSLSINTIKNLINIIKEKADIKFINMKAIASLLNEDSIMDLKNIGIDRLSITINDPNDKYSNYIYSIDKICTIIKLSLKNNLLININMVYGLLKKNEDNFIKYINSLIESRCPQISLIPTKNISNNDSYDIIENEEIRILEKCGRILCKAGYKRKDLYSYLLNEKEEPYDLLNKMLSTNFIGLGPNAVSCINKYTLINPDIGVYCYNLNRENKKSFICYDQGITKTYKKFLKTFYSLGNKEFTTFSPQYYSYMFLFTGGGYLENSSLTPKGINFAHKLITNVMVSFPTPLKNTNTILNYNEYLRRKKDAGLP